MGRGSAFGIVHVDDLARLSRDLGDTWQIVFRDPAAVSVKVIDVTTGLASEGAGARLTFGALAPSLGTRSSALPAAKLCRV